MGAVAATGWLFSSVTAIKAHKEISEPYEELEEALPQEMSASEYFNGILLIHLIREVELYLTETLKFLLSQYPFKLSSTQFSLNKLLQATKEELIYEAAESQINAIMYKKTMDYLSDLCDLMSIEKSVIQPKWSVYVEAKARRDLGFHNDWKVNGIYTRKCDEAGINSPLKLGELACPDSDYIHSIYDHCVTLIKTFNNLLLEKYT